LLKKIYLVDVENIGFKTYDSNDDSILVFYITQSSKYSSSLSSNCRIISYQHNGCKDALDFILDTYLGYLIATYGKSVEYIIESNDKGYENVCGFWLEQGYRVTSTTLKLINKLNPKSYKGYVLVRDMTYNDSKRCSNIFRTWLAGSNKDIIRLRENLFHSLNKSGYSKKEIGFIADYLYHCIELEFSGRKEIFSVKAGG
jgi:hypothetical protein